MAGIKVLRKIQLGRESTAGTKVVASTLWRGMGALEDKTEPVFTDENIGYLSGVDRTYIPKVEAGISIDEIEATFEQLPHLLEMGVKTVTPAQDGGSGSDYIYTYTFPTTAPNTIKTYTLEGGDNEGAEVMAYVFAEKIGLKGAPGEALMMSADLIGRQIAPQAFTGAIAVPSVESILFQRGKLYIDAASGTMGSTQKASTWLGFNLEITTGWKAVWTGDGDLYYTFIKNTGPEVLLEVTFEHDAISIAEKAAHLAQTPRQIRMLFEGAAVTTPGTTYSKKTLIVDLVGKWESFGKLDDQDGNNVVTGKLRARYNSVATKFAEIKVVNELASLP